MLIHPDDPSPLTPAMLLTMKDEQNPAPLEQMSEEDKLAYGKKRYRRVQFLSNQFWQLLRSEYLQTLSKRHNWKTRLPCISEGDNVLIRDPQSSRNQWPLGRVVSVKRSGDNLVRSANIALPPLKKGAPLRTMNRAINDLVLLMSENEHQH